MFDLRPMSESQMLKYSWPAAAFKEQITRIPDDATIIFAVNGNPIVFQRAKERGDKIIQLEFGEAEAFPLKSNKR